MRTVYICVGLPGSGKSTWCRLQTKCHLNTVIISKDSLRSMIHGRYIFDKEYEPLIARMSYACFDEAMLDDNDIIIDEVNITREYRKQWLIRCSVFDKKIFVWCKKPNPLKYRMLDSRGGTEEQWQAVIDDMAKKFEEPSLSEGVDEIILEHDPI